LSAFATFVSGISAKAIGRAIPLKSLADNFLSVSSGFSPRHCMRTNASVHFASFPRAKRNRAIRQIAAGRSSVRTAALRRAPPLFTLKI
jgi:hypothetical protein